MTPEDFQKWVAVLRVDPFVLFVLGYTVFVLRRQHEQAVAMLRSIRDEIMQLSGRLVLPDDVGDRQRRRRPPEGH